MAAPKKVSVIPLRDAGADKEANTDRGNDNALFQGVPVGRPVCPNHVKGDAKKHWDYMAKQLEMAGMLSTIDQGTFSNLCLYYGKMRAAEIEIQEAGTEYQIFANGVVQLSPAAVNFQRYSQMYNKLAAKFAATPVDRQKVRVENPNQGGLDL